MCNNSDTKIENQQRKEIKSSNLNLDSQKFRRKTQIQKCKNHTISIYKVFNRVHICKDIQL